MIIFTDILAIGIVFAVVCMVADVVQQGLTDYSDDLDTPEPQLLNE